LIVDSLVVGRIFYRVIPVMNLVTRVILVRAGIVDTISLIISIRIFGVVIVVSCVISRVVRTVWTSFIIIGIASAVVISVEIIVPRIVVGEAVVARLVTEGAVVGVVIRTTVVTAVVSVVCC
jgi:hypothetical protein